LQRTSVADDLALPSSIRIAAAAAADDDDELMAPAPRQHFVNFCILMTV